MSSEPRWPVALAVGVPLAAFLATASGFGYWLDGGEFVAQGADFGIAHPPGHPLAGVLHTAAVWLLPLGSAAFRVALASAFCGAAAAGFLFRAARTTFRSLGSGQRASSLLAVAAAWTAAGSFGWWFQSVRPEVYALQALLIMVAIDRLVALEAAWPTADLRPLYTAAFSLGLALANHHFLALLLLPAGAGLLARVVLDHGRRSVSFVAGFGFLGLTTYAYLPLRAHSATLALGTPDTLAKFWWVVSAEAFQKNQGGGVPQPLGERFADVAICLVESLHWAPILLALGGLYAVLRLKSSRRLGLVWALVLIVFVSARAWLGFVRDNPDALGYLMPALGAVVVLAGAFLVVVCKIVGRTWLSQGVAALVLVGSAFSLAQTAPRASLASFRDTDAIDDVMRRELPANAVLVLFNPHSIFRYWGGESAERLRPDVTVVPVPFLPYPGLADGLTEAHPELRELLRAYMLRGELRQPDLQSLAAERPLLIELDPRVPPALYDTLVPDGVWHRVLAGGATDADQREGAAAQEARWSEFYRVLGEPTDPETRRQLLWRHYQDALFLAATGHRTAAGLAVERGLAIEPMEAPLVGLKAALADGEGPVDTEPFRVTAEF